MNNIRLFLKYIKSAHLVYILFCVFLGWNNVYAQAVLSSNEDSSRYKVNSVKDQLVTLRSRAGTCEQFSELTFKTKESINGTIIIKEIDGNNEDKIPVENKKSIVYPTCSITLENIDSSDLSEIKLTTVYPKKFVDYYGIAVDELKYFTSNSENSSLGNKINVLQVGEVSIDNNAFIKLVSEIPQLPLYFVLVPDDAEVALEVEEKEEAAVSGSTETTPPSAANNLAQSFKERFKRFTTQIIMLFAVGLGISTITILYRIFRNKEKKEEKKNLKKPVFW